MADTQEQLYSRFNYQQLFTYRSNLGIQLRRGEDTEEKYTCLAEDGFTESQVGREKLGKRFKDVKVWRLFSEVTGTIWRCNHFNDYYNT